MNGKTTLISIAKAAELPAILSYYPGEQEDLEEEIESRCLYLLKQGNKLLGVACVKHDLSETLFAKTRSFRKGDILLNDIGYRGEPLAVLTRFAIASPIRGKEEERDFLKSLFAKYKGSTWIFPSPQNDMHVLSFFKDFGFRSLGQYSELEGKFVGFNLLYKIYKKEGLCSNPWF